MSTLPAVPVTPHRYANTASRRNGVGLDVATGQHGPEPHATTTIRFVTFGNRE